MPLIHSQKAALNQFVEKEEKLELLMSLDVTQSSGQCTGKLKKTRRKKHW